MPTYIKILTVLVLGFSIFSLFFNLGGMYLEDYDEALYVWMSKNAVETNNYVYLEYLNTGVNWSKTPIPLYPMMVSFKVFGISEFSARLGSVVFGLGLLLQIFLVANRYYGFLTGLIAVLITVTITQLMFYHGLRYAGVEGITLFFVFGSISCWVLLKRINFKIICTAACLGFAFLCKGPIIAIPLVVILLSLFIENPFKQSTTKSLFMAIGAFFIVVLPWYLYMYSLYGETFVSEHIVYNFIQRYLQGIEGHQYGYMYFLNYLVEPGHFPWYGVAIVSMIYFIKKYSEERKIIEFVLMSMVFVTFFIATQSRTALWWYIYPIYPPLAIIMARTLSDFVYKQNYLNKTAYYLGFMVILTYTFNYLFYFYGNIKSITKAGFVITIIFIISLLINKYRPQIQQKYSLILVGLLFIIPIYKTVDLAKKKDFNAPVLAVAESINADEPTKYLGHYPSAIYYLSKKENFNHYSLEDLRYLIGQKTIINDEVLDGIIEKTADGKIQITIDSNIHSVGLIESKNGYSLIKIE